MQVSRVSLRWTLCLKCHTCFSSPKASFGYVHPCEIISQRLRQQNSVAICCQSVPTAGLHCLLCLGCELCSDHLPHIIDCQRDVYTVLMDKDRRKFSLQGQYLLTSAFLFRTSYLRCESHSQACHGRQVSVNGQPASLRILKSMLSCRTILISIITFVTL